MVNDLLSLHENMNKDNEKMLYKIKCFISFKI